MLLGDADIRASGDLAGHEITAASYGNTQNENDCVKEGERERLVVVRYMKQLVDSVVILLLSRTTANGPSLGLHLLG